MCVGELREIEKRGVRPRSARARAIVDRVNGEGLGSEANPNLFPVAKKSLFGSRNIDTVVGVG